MRGKRGRQRRSRPLSRRLRARSGHIRPVAAHQQRGAADSGMQSTFAPSETWYEPHGGDEIRYVAESPGAGYVHPVTLDEVAARIADLPAWIQSHVEVVQLSRMTRKRQLFPVYGMQWGSAVYLYAIEDSLVETYGRPPRPAQVVEARMFGGRWKQVDGNWELRWTEKSIRDFYLNNVLVHEIGHIIDDRNTTYTDRERYAEWFAIEYGYRASRGRR